MKQLSFLLLLVFLLLVASFERDGVDARGKGLSRFRRPDLDLGLAVAGPTAGSPCRKSNRVNKLQSKAYDIMSQY